jgi:hypothetical protein
MDKKLAFHILCLLTAYAALVLNVIFGIWHGESWMQLQQEIKHIEKSQVLSAERNAAR